MEEMEEGCRLQGWPWPSEFCWAMWAVELGREHATRRALSFKHAKLFCF
jgi:hypothetical protein